MRNVKNFAVYYCGNKRKSYVYLGFGRKNEALVQYNRALSLLKSSEKSNGAVDAVSKNINLITDKINAVCA